MKLSILIPTYSRPDNLQRCLEALKLQTRPADQIVLVIRPTDEATHTFLRDYDRGSLPLQIADVEIPGMIQAYNRGLEEVNGDIVAITDDDTAPHADWLERIEAHYRADAKIGGVGGRDYQPSNPAEANETVVGRLQWFGRMIGAHHLGTGPAREVEILKGANCSYRTIPLKAIGFDTRLLGKGAQVHNEVVLGLAFRRAGWKLIYDPAVLLTHYPAVRFDYDQRGAFNKQGMYDQAHNATMAIWEHLEPGLPRVAFLLWAFLIGTVSEPGLAQALRIGLRDRRALQKLIPCLAGRIAGLRTASKTRRPETLALDSAPTFLAVPVASPSE